MTHYSQSRSRFGFAALSLLTIAGGTLSLLASARQSPPTSASAKKAALSALPPPAGKQPTLPGFDKTAEPRRNPLTALPVDTAQATGSQKPADLVMEDPDVNLKTGINKGKNFIYTEGETRVTGAAATYNKKTKELDAQGKLELDDPKHHVTGDKSHVDRNAQLATITGSVVITLKPTPPDPGVPQDNDSAKQRQHPVIITCDRVDDHYKKDFIVLTGHLIFKQTITKDDGKTVERTMTADHAEYDGQANKLHLFQPVKASDTEGQNIEFEKDAYVGTKEGEETLTSTGKSKIKFNLDDTKNPDEKPADPKGGKDAGAPPPPKKTN